MTRIRASLGTVWGTVLYFWPLVVWFVLVLVGLVQVIWAALALDAGWIATIRRELAREPSINDRRME